MKHLLCLDAGFAAMGYAVISLPDERIIEHGTVTTKPANKKLGVRVADDLFQRCQSTVRELSSVVLKYSVNGVVVELPHGGAQSASAARAMAMATALVACLTEHHGLPVECTTPDAGKRIVKPKGPVTKEEVAARVQERFNLPAPLSEHASDAAAAYLSARDGQMVRLMRQEAV